MEREESQLRNDTLSKKTVLAKCIFVILLITPLMTFYSVYFTTYLLQPVPKTAWVSWYDDPDTRVYIGWETEDSNTGIIRYGLDPDNLNEQETETEAKKIHNLNLTSLSPDSEYYYEIEINGETYTKGSFRTAPQAYIPFKFGLTSDTQQKLGPGWHSLLAKVFDTKNYSFIAMVGDFVEEGIKAEWIDYFSRASKFLDTIPLVPVKGNHDKSRDLNQDGTNEFYFMDYFPQTQDSIINQNQYDTEKQFFFSFNWSSVHFQILNIPEVDIDDFNEEGGINPRDYYQAFTEDHLDWIEQDLKNAQTMPFRITLFHCPITGAGFYGPNKVLINELLPILHEYNVTATVHGHAHHFERGILENPIHENQDLNYFVVGCGGGLADIALRPVPETVVCAGSPCYTEGYATSDSLTFTTYTPDGSVVDTITISAEGIM